MELNLDLERNVVIVFQYGMLSSERNVDSIWMLKAIRNRATDLGSSNRSRSRAHCWIRSSMRSVKVITGPEAQ